jgi:hypothetical protein
MWTFCYLRARISLATLKNVLIVARCSKPRDAAYNKQLETGNDRSSMLTVLLTGINARPFKYSRPLQLPFLDEPNIVKDAMIFLW